ncbi:sugar phosphate nucleotidyltransferase [Candidatus Omnitrophota bacterium]
MQTIFLAGGLGTRLQAKASNIPKSMVPILGKPFLQYELEMLKRHNITNIILAIGYLGKQIIDYFGDGSKFGLNINYSIESKPVGTGGGIKLASDLLEDEFFVMYGDSYLPIDYQEFMAFFKASGKIGALVLYDNKCGDTTVPCNVSINKNMVITQYAKNLSENDLHLVEAGVMAFQKTVLGFIPDQRVVSLEEEIFPLLIKQNELLGFVSCNRFYDIGLPSRLKEFEEYIKNDYIEDSV